MPSPQALRIEPEPAVIQPEALRHEIGGDNDGLLDLRFRDLFSAGDWARLPVAIRRRFTKRLAAGATAVYAGEVAGTRITFIGRVFGELVRVIGAPLPLSRDVGVPAIVSVTEDMRAGGQVWTRQFSRRRKFPQVIHTAKRFSGPTGLEEYVGRGVSMALTVHAVGESLVFRSTGYWVQVGARRFRLPEFLTPGRMVVTHAELGDGRFIFTLQVIHPVFGEIIRQSAVFSEVVS
jgi:hypothetical protein